MPSTPLRVVCALVFHGGRVLAARQDPRRAFPLLWEFPGGKIEDGESAEAALHRELEEELRLRVRIRHALEPVRFAEDGHHLELIPFVCEPDQVNGVIPLDHVEVRWIEPGEAAGLDWAPADVPLVRDLPEIHRNLP